MGIWIVLLIIAVIICFIVIGSKNSEINDALLKNKERKRIPVLKY